MPVQSSTNPNDEVLEVETLNENEVISCLWSKSATEKCRVGLADILLYEKGTPVRWYVTGKTGEILKKKGVDIPALKQRWEKIVAKSEAEYIGIVRQEGGVMKFLAKEAWEDYIRNKVPDPSILSLHCFIKGQSTNIFRNTFTMKDRLGRFATNTFTYSYGGPDYDRTAKGAKQGDKNTDPVLVVIERDCKFTESRATAIKNIMDLATNTVVRYIENMLGIKILELSVDYVIDAKSQLWMLWTSEAKIVRSTNLAAVTIPGLATGDRSGRMGWAGEKYVRIDMFMFRGLLLYTVVAL